MIPNEYMHPSKINEIVKAENQMTQPLETSVYCLKCTTKRWIFYNLFVIYHSHRLVFWVYLFLPQRLLCFWIENFVSNCWFHPFFSYVPISRKQIYSVVIYSNWFLNVEFFLQKHPLRCKFHTEIIFQELIVMLRFLDVL